MTELIPNTEDGADNAQSEEPTLFGQERAERHLAEAWAAIRDALEELNRHPQDPAGDLVARQKAADILFKYQHDFKSKNSRSNTQ